MDWRWMGRLAGVMLLLGAGVVLLLGVQVRGSTARAGTCGSAWDVVGGRTGWPQWWSHDLTDPLDGAGGRPVRTVLCPDAVNNRILASGGMAAAAVALMAAGAVVHRRRRPADRARQPRLAAFGTAATAVGAVLTVAGLVGLALLTADPNDALFLYVSRPAVLLVGLLLLLPAVLLVALGWLVRAVGQQAERLESHHAP